MLVRNMLLILKQTRNMKLILCTESGERYVALKLHFALLLINNGSKGLAYIAFADV